MARARMQERMDKLWGDCTHAGDDAQAPSTPVRNKVIGEFELERLRRSQVRVAWYRSGEAA